VLAFDVEVRRRRFTVAVALEVADGERIALFGPSGSGKTTVLEAVAGLQPLDRGHVTLGGRLLTRSGAGRTVHVPLWERGIVLLRQDAALFPHLDVRANLTYAGDGDPARLAHLVDRLEIGGLLRVHPGELSGGQAQRVALGRALLSRHGALLLDEPYVGLDGRLRPALTALVRAELAARSIPGILVAHELTEAQSFADRLGIVDRGRLLQVASPHEVVRHPATRRVAELVGYLGFVRSGDRVVAVHPERVRPGSWPDLGVVLAGRTVGLRPAGAGYEVTLDVDGAPVVYRVDEAPPTAGAPCEVTALDPPRFPASSGDPNASGEPPVDLRPIAPGAR
jgi:ABC-type sulfate/molybdate transport systems ATPase subunit